MNKSNFSLFLVLLFLYACKHELPKNIHKQLEEEAMGHWINQSSFSLIKQLDTSDVTIHQATQILSHVITEIDLDDLLFDSVLISKENEDVLFLKMESYTNHRLTLSDSSVMVFSEDYQSCLYVLSNRRDSIWFDKAPEHLMKNPIETNQLTTFRFMLNASLNPFTYLLVDSIHKREDRSYVNFFANEILRGYYDYNYYRIELASEKKMTDDALLISLKGNRGSKVIGAIYYADSVELFQVSLKNNQAYVREQKIGTLLKHKWEN